MPPSTAGDQNIDGQLVEHMHALALEALAKAEDAQSRELAEAGCSAGPLHRAGAMVAQCYEGVREATLARSPTRVKDGLVAVESHVINLPIWTTTLAPFVKSVEDRLESVRCKAECKLQSVCAHQTVRRALRYRSVDTFDDIAAIQCRIFEQVTEAAATKCADALHQPSIAPYCTALSHVNHNARRLARDPKAALREARCLTVRLVETMSEKGICNEATLDLVTRALYYGWVESPAKQVLVKPLSGPTRVLRVRHAQTVAQLKQTLGDMEGIPVAAQRLLYGARELDDDSALLLEAHVEDKAMLHLGLRDALAGGMRVRVKPMSTGAFELDVAPEDSVAQMMQKLQQRDNALMEGATIQFFDVEEIRQVDRSQAVSSTSVHMDPEALLRSVVDLVNDASSTLQEVAHRLLARDCTVIDPNFGQYEGIAECIRFYETLAHALGSPRLVLTSVERSQGSRLRTRWRLTATLEHELFGIAACGQAITVEGWASHAFSYTPAGAPQIVLSEYSWNAIALMQQLAAPPANAYRHAELPIDSDSDVTSEHLNSSGPSSSPTPSPQLRHHSQSQHGDVAHRPVSPLSHNPDDMITCAAAPNAGKDVLSQCDDTQLQGLHAHDPAMEDPLDTLALIPEDALLNLVSQDLDFDMFGGDLNRTQMNPVNLERCVVKQELNEEWALDTMTNTAALDTMTNTALPESAPMPRCTAMHEGPVHGSKVCLQFLEYQCGYCGDRKISTSAGSDGRVRIRCECGGKHGDQKPRMHAKWKLCSDKPIEDPDEAHRGVLVGGRPFTGAKRAARASGPY